MATITRYETASIVVSTVALVVSGLTWVDVRQQVRLFAGQIRSYVQVTDVALDRGIEEASFITLRLKVKNFGQTAATNVQAEMDYGVGMPDPSGKGNAATRLKFGAMGPGMERTLTLKSNRINRFGWPVPRQRGETAYFWGTVWFTDDTTREERKEDWCYSLPLRVASDLQRTDLVPCEILTYTSKNSRPE